MIDARRLREPNEFASARRALQQVFSTPNTALPRFGPNARARMVIQPVDRELAPQLRSIIADALSSGPLMVYFTSIGRWETIAFEARENWIVDDFRDPELYDKLDASGWDHLSESAVYDAEGRWGMLVAFESYAIVAGDPIFIENLRATLPSGVTWGIEPLRLAQGPPRAGYDLTWLDRLEAALAEEGGAQP